MLRNHQISKYIRLPTAAEEEHSSGASLASESSDAKAATGSNSHIKFDSHRLEDKKLWHRNNAKKTEPQTSGSSHSSVTKKSSTKSEVGKEKEQPKSEEYFMVPGYEVRSEYVLKKSVDKSKLKKSTDGSSKEVKSSYFGYK
ncbi:unnamed protein product [Bursaphelenchus okinawaensis]|uniref:Uncharacterized protein n=1 Tax=Bursaphelenchus okinawaensis TaxID=465554 RepID=A0A811KCD2_9BILA|nr:unnamed protein product [Bursaphelenchus okinawaensis]CAG9098048.1 unnamed protein product [Bursaphelenchus okinawaensis]